MNVKEKGKRRFSLSKKVFILVLAVFLISVVLFPLPRDFRTLNVSGVDSSADLGVYWDAQCNNNVLAIDWGEVSPGSEHHRVIFVKNEGSEGLVLSLNTSDWDPLSASLKIFLCWDYDGRRVYPDNVVKLTLKLYVLSSISGIDDFRFFINIGTGFKKSGDINGDGLVDVSDATLFAFAWLSTAGSSRYDYRCDFNNDGHVDIQDATALVLEWFG